MLCCADTVSGLVQGVGVLLLDEFHERSLDADTALALALDCQAWTRPDLRYDTGGALKASDIHSSAGPNRIWTGRTVECCLLL